MSYQVLSSAGSFSPLITTDDDNMLFEACIQVLKGPTYVPAFTLPALKVYMNIYYTTGQLGKYGSSCLFSLLQPTSSEESAEETSGDYLESIDS